MRLKEEQGFCTEACLDNVAFFLVRDGWLAKEELHVVLKLDSEYEVVVDSISRLQKIDFSSLPEPHLDYKDQEEIDPHQVDIFSLCLVHHGLDFGCVFKYCNHEYVDKHCNRDRVHRELSPHSTMMTWNRLTTSFSNVNQVNYNTNSHVSINFACCAEIIKNQSCNMGLR